MDGVKVLTRQRWVWRRYLPPFMTWVQPPPESDDSREGLNSTGEAENSACGCVRQEAVWAPRKSISQDEEGHRHSNGHV